MKIPHLMVIDPAVRKPELAAYNWLARRSSLPSSYHLPALHGMKSLEKESVETIAGIVIFGSLSSVNERTEWQKQLEKWLLPVLEKKIPTFGICYGHQMLAHMFGGKVKYAFEDQKKHLGTREVSFTAESLLGKAGSGHLCVSHNEVVYESGTEMTVVGKSQDIEIDALRHRTLPIWSVQPHPEAGCDFLKIRGDTKSLDEKELAFGYELIGAFLKLVEKAKK